jgi:hypothetical protein
VIQGIARAVPDVLSDAGMKTSVDIRNTHEADIPLIPDTDFPGLAAYFIIIFPDNELRGRHVYFVEQDHAVVEWARKREWSRASKLLITAEDAAGRTPVSLPL